MMRTLFLVFSIILLLVPACQNDPKPDSNAQKDNTPRADTLPVYTPATSDGAVDYTVTSGTVYWSAKKAIGDPHYGSIEVSEGVMQVKDGKLISGAATINMNAIGVSDPQDPKERADLTAHLMDADFFDVKKYPMAKFTIDEVLPSTNPNYNAIVRGQLTMKNKTNPVNIPAKLEVKGDELIATTLTFPINRTLWGVNFRSGVLGTAKDKLIEDVITLTISLKAKKVKG